MDVNAELQGKLVEFMDMTLSGLENGAAFLQGELPDYIKELLLWYGTYHFLMLLIGIGLLSLFLWLDYKFYRMIKERSDWGDDEVLFIYFGLGSIARLPLYGITMAEFLNLYWLKIWLAPKVWLVEYVLRLTGAK